MFIGDIPLVYGTKENNLIISDVNIPVLPTLSSSDLITPETKLRGFLYFSENLSKNIFFPQSNSPCIYFSFGKSLKAFIIS